MPTNRFKKRVRERMRETGENYTRARFMLLAESDQRRLDKEAPAQQPTTKEEIDHEKS